ncbi:polysaccharide biosynthesis/export family protein [Roseomonas mucosa]
MSLLHPSGSRHVLSLLLAAPMLASLAVPAARAQPNLLMPPSLPSTLPGGQPLPGALSGGLAGGAQGDLVQRLLDAASGRSSTTLSPPPPLPPAAPIPAMPAATAGTFPGMAPPPDPLSNTESFFAARLPEQQPPLRQFGYDSFRQAAVPGLTTGAMPEGYLLGRDDEVIIAVRGRVRTSYTLRVGRDGMLTLPDLAPIPAAGRSLGELRAEIEARVARELGGSEAYVSLGQTRQIAVFVAGRWCGPACKPCRR